MWFSVQEYHSPTASPCLLYHKSTALVSHKLCDTRKSALRDTTLCAVKCELLRFSKGVLTATSQKYYPAGDLLRSFPFFFLRKTVPVGSRVKSHFLLFNSKPKKPKKNKKQKTIKKNPQTIHRV